MRSRAQNSFWARAVVSAWPLILLAGVSHADADLDARLVAVQDDSQAPIRASLDSGAGRLTKLRGRFPTRQPPGQAAARAFLARHAAAFGLRADLSDLRLVRQVEDRGGLTLAFERLHAGVPVFAREVVVGFATDGAIVHVAGRPVLDLPPSIPPVISANRARALAAAALGPLVAGRPAPRLVVVRGDKAYPGNHFAWQVDAVPRPRGSEAWYVFVASDTGAIVRTIDRIRYAGPACVPCNAVSDPDCGHFFFHGPVVELDDTSVRDADNVDAAQVSCELDNLTSGTSLTGTYADTSITSPRVGPPYNYLRSVNERAVDELTSYFHVDRSKRYLNALGFPGVMNFALDIDAHDAAVGDNAYYSPVTIELHFGQGGVDDGQDPDIVYHEYGHAIQDNQVPGFGQTDEGGAMGEAFGDYWAAALMEEASQADLGPECMGEWDATAFNPWNGSFGSGCLRRLDNAWEYPRDLRYEVHDDGEIWNAALWSLRTAIGGATADELVIKSHTLLTSTADFVDGGDALLSADVLLNAGASEADILDALRTYGLPHTGTVASSTGLDQLTAYACESTHNYADFEFVECTFTQPGAERLRFRFERLETETGYDLVYISDADYGQVQVLTGNPYSGGTGFSAAVHGETIVARFKADFSIQDWGFRIDAVEHVQASCTDSDADSVCDLDDNCPLVPNAGQAASTQDGLVGHGCACLCGDVNSSCTVNAVDAQDIQLHILPNLGTQAGCYPLGGPDDQGLCGTPQTREVRGCDANSGGTCSASDAQVIQNSLPELVGTPSFPLSTGYAPTNCAQSTPDPIP